MNMKKKSKRTLALLLISALLAGILPLSGSAPVQAAGYGLNNPTTDANGNTIWDCLWFGNHRRVKKSPKSLHVGRDV